MIDLQQLEGVFQRLHRAGLKLKSTKCELFQKEIRYFGHILTADGASTDPEKVQSIKERTPFSELKEASGFPWHDRGLPSVPEKYVMFTRPLNQLTAKELSGSEVLQLK